MPQRFRGPWALVLLLLSAASAQAASVVLEWDAPSLGEPQGYRMYRHIVPGGQCGAAIVPNFELLGVAPVGVQPTFTDTSPVVGANYYHVTAYNDGGESLPSNQVCFRLLQKPGAPQNLRGK